MKIPILTYHSIDNSGSVISVAPSRFREHMEFLKSSNTPVVSLGQVAAWIRGETTLPKDCVALTFDDGFRSFHQEAVPLLREFQFPATVFIVTGHCGGKNDWPGQSEGIPVMDLMNWAEISELSAQGIDFGSHTVHHPDFSTNPVEEATNEIVQSMEMLQQHTGKQPQFFAYPYGIRSEASAAFVREHFDGACSVVMDFAEQGSDRFFLPRIDMYYFSGNSHFSRFGTVAFDWYVRGRSLLRSLKQRSY